MVPATARHLFPGEDDSSGQALGSCDAFLDGRERTDRNVISVGISERELPGLSVRIYVWLLFEPSDE
jgi:hypothetical protein